MKDFPLFDYKNTYDKKKFTQVIKEIYNLRKQGKITKKTTKPSKV